MTLRPDPIETLARARADLRMGVPVVLWDGTRGLMAAAAESVSAARLDQIKDLAGVTVTITNWRAETLKAAAYDGDIARIILPGDADLRWLNGVADPSTDLSTPMKGPFRMEREGDATLHRAAVALAKSARLLPTVLTAPVPEGFAADNDLTLIDLSKGTAEITEFSPLHAIVSAGLPLSVSEAGRLHVFRPEDGGEEHYAVEIGAPDREQPVLTRLHSACLTGDLLGSLKCDCGPQLRGAMAQMGEEGAGILLYLNQEGRGIGLANKMRAYSLQDQGFDTVDANHRLGFEDDERDFRIGSEILKSLGVTRIRLLTNNPAKSEMMEANGIVVTAREPLKVGENAHNHDYLATKAKKSGHIL